MYISIDTNELKTDDARVLRAIADSLEGTKAAPTPAVDVVKEDRKAEQAKPVAKKATKAPKAEPEAPADPEPDEAGSDPLEDAVARATSLVQDGKTPLVKKALAAVGVKRVSELKESDVEDFLAALGDDD